MLEFNAIMDSADEIGDLRVSTNKPTRRDFMFIAYAKKYDIHLPTALSSIDSP